MTTNPSIVTNRPMTKIVINACYGGFGLSIAALKRAVAENAPYIISETEAAYFGDSKLDLNGSPHLTELIDAGDDFKCTWTKSTLHKDGLVYFVDRSDYNLRDDPCLVKLVEEMGAAASSRYAELKVVEIPDDVEWVVEEEDGREIVAEKHRTWS